MTFTVKNVDWGKDKHKLRKLRNKIFVCHWRIPQEYEFDQQDKDAYHVLVVDENNQDVATSFIVDQSVSSIPNITPLTFGKNTF